MDSKEFKKLRKKLNKTQKEIAQLLGLSVKKSDFEYWQEFTTFDFG